MCIAYSYVVTHSMCKRYKRWIKTYSNLFGIRKGAKKKKKKIYKYNDEKKRISFASHLIFKSNLLRSRFYRIEYSVYDVHICNTLVQKRRRRRLLIDFDFVWVCVGWYTHSLYLIGALCCNTSIYISMRLKQVYVR